MSSDGQSLDYQFTEEAMELFDSLRRGDHSTVQAEELMGVLHAAVRLATARGNTYVTASDMDDAVRRHWRISAGPLRIKFKQLDFLDSLQPPVVSNQASAVLDRAVRLLRPMDRARYAEEWSGDLAGHEGVAAQLKFAFEVLLWSAPRVRLAGRRHMVTGSE